MNEKLEKQKAIAQFHRELFFLMAKQPFKINTMHVDYTHHDAQATPGVFQVSNHYHRRQEHGSVSRTR